MTQPRADGLVEAPCPRCGSARSTVRLRSRDRQFPVGGTFFASACDGCGLLHQNPHVPLERLSEHYPSDYSPYRIYDIELNAAPLWHLKHRQGYAHLDAAITPTAKEQRYGAWSSHYHLIPDFTPGGRLIEIGCAAGSRLMLLKKLGWEHCTGYEYSDSAASTARERGLEVVAGPIEDSLDAIPDGSLDAIIAGFVIEHVQDPYALTRRMAAKLRPGGQFLFCTLNIASLDYWLYREHWLDLDLPRHFTFFRREDIVAMLEPAFAVENMLTEAAVSAWTISANYRREDGVGGLRGAFDRALLAHAPRTGPLLALQARLGLGGRIYVSARKR